MLLTNTLDIDAAADDVFRLINDDVEKVATCVPGAAITGKDGDTFLGGVKVKVGPISASYSGTIRFLEIDRDARTLKLAAKGADSHGNGDAEAEVAITVEQRRQRIAAHTCHRPGDQRQDRLVRQGRDRGRVEQGAATVRCQPRRDAGRWPSGAGGCVRAGYTHIPFHRFATAVRCSGSWIGSGRIRCAGHDSCTGSQIRARDRSVSCRHGGRLARHAGLPPAVGTRRHRCQIRLRGRMAFARSTRV